ncbi:hypothetical protein ACLESO_50935, partial [Pyxidicoccus sp. 3LG]
MYMSQWKKLCTVVIPLTALAGTSVWAGPLRPLTDGMDQATLKADARYMRRVFEQKEAKGPKGPEEFIRIDLADPAQHRFVMNRLHAAGKTLRNSPRLFERLSMARQKALTREEPGIGRSTLTSNAWGCDHFIVMDNGTAVNGNRPYASGPVGSCLNGASYIYADVVAYNANYTETDSTIVGSNSGEEYGAGTNFNAVTVNPSLPVNAQRQIVVDSMMIAMNENTGEELITFSSAKDAVTSVPVGVVLDHPRFAPSSSTAPRTRINSCQLRGGTDCDYAVVNNAFQPYAANATGVAMRKTESPWTGDSTAFFPFPSGGFDSSKVYVPMKLTFDAGAEVVNGTLTNCKIKSVNGLLTKLRLTKQYGGGTCVSSVDLSAEMTTYLSNNADTRTIPINRLLNLSSEANASGSSGDCSMARIANEVLEFALTINTRANCGLGDVPRNITFRSKARGNWDLYVWNSCMAEGTKIV